MLTSSGFHRGGEGGAPYGCPNSMGFLEEEGSEEGGGGRGGLIGLGRPDKYKGHIDHTDSAGRSALGSWEKASVMG